MGHPIFGRQPKVDVTTIVLNSHPPFDAAVIGAGLTGSCVAMELAGRGLSVALVEQDALLMNRASLRNEGKIHLGFVYALDESLETARLMMKGATTFDALLRRWVGDRIDEIPRSTPFDYVVAPDSILSSDRIQRHFACVDACYRETIAASPRATYLGVRPARLYSAGEARNGSAVASFRTAELAIDTDVLAATVRGTIAAESNIEVISGLRVDGVERQGGLFKLDSDGGSARAPLFAHQVVNASWARLVRLDRHAGLVHNRGWVHRLKYRAIAKIGEAESLAPSITIVIGKYGDVVIRPDATAYLSWYPVAMRGWSDDPDPPDDWDAAERGIVPAVEAAALFEKMRDSLSHWMPEIRNCEMLRVGAGVIVAHGETDIDDPGSGLHFRTKIGVRSESGFHSVNPGKLTTAPMYAFEAAERVVARANASAALQIVKSNGADLSKGRSVPSVVGLVPAWKAEAFIRRTLESLAGQSYPNLRFIVSDDASPDRTAEICEAFAATDDRFTVVRQPWNLGWIEHVRALFELGDADYFFLGYHDDEYSTDFIEKLVEAAESETDLVGAYCDYWYTDFTGRAEQRGLDNLDECETAYDRLVVLIRDRSHAFYPHRGVIRYDAARRAGPMTRHPGGQRGAGCHWSMQLAAQGPFVRVPEPLIHKNKMEEGLSNNYEKGLLSDVGWYLGAGRAILGTDLSAGKKAKLVSILATTFVRVTPGRIKRRYWSPL